jgi:hypothetical protein
MRSKRGVLLGLFAWCAISFGLLIGFVQASVAIGVTAGLALAAFIVLVTIGFDRFGSRGREFTSPHQSMTVQVPEPIEVVRERVLRMLKRMAVDVKIVDYYKLSVQTAMSWRSYGELVEVGLTTLGSGTALTVTSTPKNSLAMVDHGKGLSNVELVVEAASAGS